MPLLRPALQEGRALHLDRGPIGRLDVEVIPPDPQRALVPYRLGDQELRKDPARGVVAQIADAQRQKSATVASSPTNRSLPVNGTAGEGVSQAESAAFLSHAQLTLRPESGR